MKDLKKGRYRHFKGREYEVLHIAQHSETLEKMVVYRQLYDDYGIWVRPLQMFTDWVEIEGKMLERFQYTGN